MILALAKMATMAMSEINVRLNAKINRTLQDKPNTILVSVIETTGIK